MLLLITSLSYVKCLELVCVVYKLVSYIDTVVWFVGSEGRQIPRLILRLLTTESPIPVAARSKA
jgi:hypothetical protein